MMMMISLHLPQPLLPPSSAATKTDTGRLFREKLVYLHSLDVDPHKALTLNPLLRTTPLSALQSIEDCLLTSFRLPRDSLSRLFSAYPDLLTSSPTSDLLPIRNFLLDDALLPLPLLPSSILRCPRLLLCDLSLTLRPSLLFLRSLGFRRILSPRSALLLVSNPDHTLRPKIEFLQERLQLEFSAVGEMAVRSPGLMTLSLENNLRPKIEFFLGEMEGDAEELREFPQFFSFSLEKRIRPRVRVLRESGLEEEMGLGEMLKISDGEFQARLVELRLRRVDRRRVTPLE